MNSLRGQSGQLKWKALLVSLGLFYFIPFLVIPIFGFVAQVLVYEAVPLYIYVLALYAWVWIAAPFSAGFVTAAMAHRVPLWHGLFIGVIGFPVYAFPFRSQPGWLTAAMFAVHIACSIGGAWTWRRRSMMRA